MLSLFEPDVVVPVQFLTRPALANRSGVFRLLLAVLEEAITHYLSGGKTWEHVDTEEWIHSPSRDFMSYLWICELFGFDAYAMRRELLRRKARGERAKFRPRLVEKKRGRVGAGK